MAENRGAESVEDISLHILDIAENSVRAEAKNIEIIISRHMKDDVLRVEVNDDGTGMAAETLAMVRDPFFTTKHKKTGLGIPLFAQAAELTGGTLLIDSVPGKGTHLSATFTWSHVDRPVIGNMADTVLSLIAGHPEIDYVYEERDDGRVFRFDTREIKDDLEGVPINNAGVLRAIRSMFTEQRIVTT